LLLVVPVATRLEHALHGVGEDFAVHWSLRGDGKGGRLRLDRLSLRDSWLLRNDWLLGNDWLLWDDWLLREDRLQIGR